MYSRNREEPWKKKKSRKKRILGIMLALCLTAAWLLRVITLNISAERVETVIYEMHEPVLLEEDFFYNGDDVAAGYEITVESAQIRSYEEYIAEYGGTIDLIPEERRPEYVYDVEIRIRNYNKEDSNSTGFNLISCRLQAVNDTMQVSDELFGLLYPHLEGTFGFSLRPETEMTMHLPYIRSYVMDKYDSYEKMKNRQYYMLLSMYPVKRMIAVEPQEVQ